MEAEEHGFPCSEGFEGTRRVREPEFGPGGNGELPRVMGFLWKIAESMAFPKGSKASGGYVAVGLLGVGVLCRK